MKVDDTSFMGDRKIIKRNPSKERKIGIKKERVSMGTKCASIATREAIFNTLVKSSRRTLKA